MSEKRRNGFTLIEVLIVIVIMAVLAATIIPQFSTSTEDAKAGQLDFNLHTLRQQVELYKLHHSGKLPVITNNALPQLTSKTNADGTVNANGTYGPYILGEIPVNPFTNSNKVTASTDGATKTGGGWLYNASTGQFWADGEAPSGT